VGVAPKQRICKLSRVILIIAVLFSLAIGVHAKQRQAGVFDYFVLALSWSPSYCASDAGQRDDSQCAPGRRFAFVVHGLWPQYNQGWPQSCKTDENWVTKENIDAMMPIMPSKKLIIHEWKKHGTCSGVSQSEYFRATRLLFEKIKVPARYLSPNADVLTTPEQLVTDFVKTNKNLNADMLSVQCGNAQDRARLSELRVCLDKRGNFGRCGANEARSCRAKQLVMPQVR
jgi:ribonuclease T2